MFHCRACLPPTGENVLWLPTVQTVSTMHCYLFWRYLKIDSFWVLNISQWKGLKETPVAWVRIHLQYVFRLTTHRPRLRFTYSCCVVRPTTHFAWRARPISWSSATPLSVALGIRVLHTVLGCHPHVVIVWLDRLQTVLSWHPHTLGCLVRPTTWCTDFLPHSQFAPLFSETFRPQLILIKDVSPPPYA